MHSTGPPERFIAAQYVPRSVGNTHPDVTLDLATSKEARSLLRLIEEAGWAYTREELERLIALQPEGMIVMRPTGLFHGPLGCVYSSVWGRVGFIGLLLVKASHRGRGLGRELMMAGLEHLEGQGTSCVCLDSVADAIGFYRALGFKTGWQSLRYGIDASMPRPPYDGVGVVRAGAKEVERAIELDRRHTGSDRSALLRRLHSDKDSTFLVVPGEKEVLAYGVLRRSKGCMRLGPVVAAPGVSDSVAVRSIVRTAIADSYPRMLTVNVPAYNRESVELMVELEAVEYSPCTRMYLGDPGPAEAPEGVWALGAAEKG